MPTYEYVCPVCDGITEVTFSIAANKPQQLPCKKCCGPAKLSVSLSSFILKGGGWYKDGYSKPTGTFSENG